MTFDPDNYQPGQSLEGSFATKEVKAQLWVNKVPFEVTAPPQRRNKRPEWVTARKDGSMPSDYQWVLSIRLLSYRGDGSFGYVLQSDGEGGQETIEHLLAFDGGSNWRDQQMNAMAQFIQEAGRAGPYRLDQGQAQGRGAAPWMIRTWKPEDAGYPPAASAPAPTPVAVASQAAPSMAPPPPAPPPVPQAPPVPTPPPVPPPPVDPYQYANRYDGAKIRWKPGMADWEVYSHQSADEIAVRGPVVHAQPLASTRVVTGVNPGDGMEGPGVPTMVTQADGSQIRQARYQGDGVVLTPQGVATQMAVGNDPIRGSQTAGTDGGALGVEEPASVSPGQAQTAQQATIRQAYDAKTTILVAVRCDHPDHTDEQGAGAVINAQAFFDPTQQVWKQTHQCPGSRKVRVMDVTSAVKQIAGVA